MKQDATMGSKKSSVKFRVLGDPLEENVNLKRSYFMNTTKLFRITRPIC